MKQKTIATRHLRTKIAAGYVLILFVIFGIVYIWLNEQHRRQELEITSQKIRCLRKDIHEVYVKMVDLSLIGETVLDWNEEDMNIYHKKRLEVDSLLSLFKSSYRSERIDSVCRLLAEKENLLNKIMLVLNEQEEIKDKIARRVPVIARKSSQEEPPKRKRTGFLVAFATRFFIRSCSALYAPMCARQWVVFPPSKGHSHVRIFPHSASHGYSRTHNLP